MKRLVLPIALVLTCAACSKPPQPEQAPKPQAAAAVATPWDSMQAQKKKAQDVQKVVDKQADDQRKAIEAQEQ